MSSGEEITATNTGVEKLRLSGGSSNRITSFRYLVSEHFPSVAAGGICPLVSVALTEYRGPPTKLSASRGSSYTDVVLLRVIHRIHMFSTDYSTGRLGNPLLRKA